VLFVALLLGACGGHKGANRSNTPRITVAGDGPLARGLLTQAQLRQVPGLAGATVTSLKETAVFEDPDPRGPCGARVPAVSLADAAGAAIKADTVRSGAEFVARQKPGAAKRYLDARIANAQAGCPEFETKTNQGVTQRVLLVRIVSLPEEPQQALAVVTAIKIADSVRAATAIEVRRDDILSRVVIFTDAPLDDATVRALASLMGQNLAVFAR
jgi:hypothetical protein